MSKKIVLSAIALLVALIVPTFAGAQSAGQNNISNITFEPHFVGVVAGVSTSAPECRIPTRTLRRGLRNVDVAALQSFLVSNGYLSADNATGLFGSLTEQAVKRFQSDNGIVSSGNSQTTGYGSVGARTLIAIRKACNGESTTPSVNQSENKQNTPSDVQPITPIQPPTAVNKCGANTFSVSEECGTNEFRSASVTCYDGTTKVLGEATSCKPSEVWQKYAAEACSNQCSITSEPVKPSLNGEDQTKWKELYDQWYRNTYNQDETQSNGEQSTEAAKLIASPTSGPASLWVNFVALGITVQGNELIDLGDGRKVALGYNTTNDGRADYYVPGTYVAKLIRGTKVLATANITVLPRTTTLGSTDTTIVTVDSTTLTLKDNKVVVSGTVKGPNEHFGISIGNNGGKEYGSGDLVITNNKWSATVEGLPVGSHILQVYVSNVLVKTATLVVRAPVVTPPTPVTSDTNNSENTAVASCAILAVGATGTDGTYVVNWTTKNTVSAKLKISGLEPISVATAGSYVVHMGTTPVSRWISLEITDQAGRANTPCSTNFNEQLQLQDAQQGNFHPTADACTNIAGDQSAVPQGYTYDWTGSCVVDNATARGSAAQRALWAGLYSCVLSRTGSDAEITAWVNQNVTSPAVAIRGFYLSPEYVSKNTSNQEFVRSLYSCLLKRTGDTAGVNGWVGQLQQGTSREAVLNGFINSAEFRGSASQTMQADLNGPQVSAPQMAQLASALTALEGALKSIIAALK